MFGRLFITFNYVFSERVYLFLFNCGHRKIIRLASCMLTIFTSSFTLEKEKPYHRWYWNPHYECTSYSNATTIFRAPGNVYLWRECWQNNNVSHEMNILFFSLIIWKNIYAMKKLQHKLPVIALIYIIMSLFDIMHF